MRHNVDGHRSHRVCFSSFELDLDTGELRQHGQSIRLQQQPLLILRALLAKPGKIVTREELRERVWRGNVFIDYEHSLNRSVNKLRVVLGDKVAKPTYVETVHGRGYRFIAPVEDGTSPRKARLVVLPVENATHQPENDDFAEGITEALIDGLEDALSSQLRVIALASVLRYRNRMKNGMVVAKVAAELSADYVLCGRLRNERGQFHLRVELVDSLDRALQWSASFLFGRDGLEHVQREICNNIADSMEPMAA